MIENVESFRPELHPQAFANREFAPHRQIHLPGTKQPLRIARNVSETGIHIHEGCWIQCLATGAPLSGTKLRRRQGLQYGSAVRAVEINRLSRKAEPLVIQVVIRRTEESRPEEKHGEGRPSCEAVV